MQGLKRVVEPQDLVENEIVHLIGEGTDDDFKQKGVLEGKSLFCISLCRQRQSDGRPLLQFRSHKPRVELWRSLVGLVFRHQDVDGPKHLDVEINELCVLWGRRKVQQNEVSRVLQVRHHEIVIEITKINIREQEQVLEHVTLGVHQRMRRVQLVHHDVPRLVDEGGSQFFQVVRSQRLRERSNCKH